MTGPELEVPSIPQIVISLILLGFLISGTIVLVMGRRYYRNRPLHHPEVDHPLRMRPWQGRDILLIILFYIAIHALLPALLSPAGFMDDDPQPLRPGVLWLNIALQIAGLAFILWLAASRHGGWRTAFGAQSEQALPPLRLAAIIYLALWPVQAIATPLYHGLLRLLDVTIDLQEPLYMLMESDSAAVIAGLLFLALVLAPVVEELFFRGILLPVFRRRLGIWPAIIISSLIFALIHFHIPSFAGLFIVSVACCLAAIWGRSVAPAIWLHAVFNAINTLLVLTWPAP